MFLFLINMVFLFPLNENEKQNKSKHLFTLEAGLLYVYEKHSSLNIFVQQNIMSCFMSSIHPFNLYKTCFIFNKKKKYPYIFVAFSCFLIFLFILTITIENIFSILIQSWIWISNRGTEERNLNEKSINGSNCYCTFKPWGKRDILRRPYLKPQLYIIYTKQIL